MIFTACGEVIANSMSGLSFKDMGKTVLCQNDGVTYRQFNFGGMVVLPRRSFFLDVEMYEIFLFSSLLGHPIIS